MNHDHRYKSLDVWRGIACLMVVLDHAGYALIGLPVELEGLEGWARRAIRTALGLALGPPMFFVISGYCIAASLDSLRRQGGNAFEFLARRIWRTLPP